MAQNGQGEPALDLFRWLVVDTEEYAIFAVDPEGRTLTWNRGVERILGWPEAEFIGLDSAEFFPPESQARGIPEEELRVARERGRASDDRWLMRRDGSFFWASGVTTALRNVRGRFIGFTKVFRDLTRQRETQEALAKGEEALRRNEERLRLALEAGKIGTWHWSLRDRTGAIDDSLRELLGLPAGTEINHLDQFLSMVHPDDRTRVAEAFDHAMQTGRTLDVEFRVVRPDGSIRHFRDHGQVLVATAATGATLTGAVVDLTEQKETERQLHHSQRMEAVGQLAGGVAHEVNNMLSVILGLTHLLIEDTSPGDPRLRDLRQVQRAAQRAAAITSQLLAFSRRQAHEAEVLELPGLVDAVSPILRGLLGELRTLVVWYEDPGCRVRADRGQLEQVLLNLVLNARDATRDGGVVTIETRSVRVDPATAGRQDPPVRPGDYCRLTVRDDGRGMDRATLARIFEPFFTTKGVGEGSGLGLAVVYGLVRQNGGFITAESTPGAGTSVHVHLPVVAEPPEEAGEAAACAPRGQGRILVVEDEEEVRHWIVRFLERQGYETVEAADGVEALARLESAKGDVDLVLADVVMPRLGGPDVRLELHRRNIRVPIIYMSGREEPAEAPPEEPGRVAFLQKPFTPQALAAKLHEVLRTRAAS
jgi:PAS domain S-box-containing protein